MLRGPPAETGDPAAPWRQSLEFRDPEALRELSGELGAHLKLVGRALSVKVSQRGGEISVVGAQAPVAAAVELLVQLHEVALTGHHIGPADVDQAARLLQSSPGTRLAELYQDVILVGQGKKRLSPRSARQQQYLHAIRHHDLVFGVGPAGTGKTYLAMAMAVSALLKDEVRRIVLARPAVEAGEKLGFLPGDLAEKVNPYLRPLYDALHDIVGYERSERLMAKGVIEVAPLAFMRGRTLSDSFVILDEAQNATPEQMKMFLTRLGLGSKVVVTGDVTQVDLPSGVRSGLVHALEVLGQMDGVEAVYFTDADVVRHPLVSAIVRAYDRAEARRQDLPRGS